MLDRKPWHEQRPIILPESKHEAALQTTLVDLSVAHPGFMTSHCRHCGSSVELDAHFCGDCGERVERPGYTRLVSVQSSFLVR